MVKLQQAEDSWPVASAECIMQECAGTELQCW